MTDQFVSLAKSFQDDIFGQPRTGRHKQYVILKGNWVYKGPFNQKRLDKLLYRTMWFQKWNTPYVVLPIEILNTSDGTFVKFLNLISTQITGVKWNTESFTGNKYRVIERSDVIKFGQGLPKESWIYDQYGESLLLALVQMWILETGDTGIFNMMIKLSTRQVYIIDFDETTGGEKDNQEFYFSRPSGKKYQWYQNMKRYYLRVAKQIKKMLTDPQNQPFFNKINLGIQLLIKYGGNQLIIKPKITLNLTTPTKNISRMKWSGLFTGTTTFSGYPPDQVKSALQKGIRRGMVEVSLYAGFELWRLAEIGGKAGQTNMYNRLAVIAGEDVGPANLNLVIYIVNYVVGDVKSKKDRSAAKLATLIQQLVMSPKTRLMSHIWRAYTDPKGVVLAIERGIQIDQKFTSDDLKRMSDPNLNRFFKEGDPVEIIPYAKMFYLRLKDRNFNAVRWLSFYLQKSQGLKVKSRNRRTKPEAIIWQILTDFLGSSLIEVLSKAYFTLSEGRPFLMTAITKILYTEPHSPKFEAIRVDNIINQGVQIWNDHSFLTKLLTGNYNFIVPDFAIDMHTREGRKRGRNREDFIREGAVVTNQDEIFHDSRLESIYNHN